MPKASEAARLIKLADEMCQRHKIKNWFDRLTDKQRETLHELRDGLHSGDIRSPIIDVARAVKDEWRLSVSLHMIRSWLGGRYREKE